MNMAKQGKSRRAKQRRRLKWCFYTGEELSAYGTQQYQKESYYLTYEHLVPKSRANGANFSQHSPLPNFPRRTTCVNKVYAASKINNIVGEAPLKVKFALKKYLSGITILPHPDIKVRMRAWSKLSKSFMRRYKVCGVWPWHWSKHRYSKGDIQSHTPEKLNERREKARKHYMDLLTLEEIQLFRLED